MGTAFSENNNGRERSIVLAEPSHSSHFPLARLIQLIVLLQTERCPNARRLAEICEVSRRTIYRDLAALAGAGISVLYRSDRQGYQLAQNVFLQPPKMEEREALALLVSCRQWGSGDDLGLSRHANQAIDKLVQCLPEGMRTRLLAAAEILSDALDHLELSPIRREVDDRILACADSKAAGPTARSRDRNKRCGDDQAGDLSSGQAPRFLVPGGAVDTALSRTAHPAGPDRAGRVDRGPLLDPTPVQPGAIPGQHGCVFESPPLLEAAGE